MSGMTNTKARSLGKKQIRAIFNSLRIKDGLGDEEIKPSEFSYWYNKKRDGQSGNYIIYEVIESSPTHRADDKVIGRDFFCQIDVFSTHSFESKQLLDILNRLEEKLVEAGFDTDFQGEDFESDTNLYHQIIYVSKLYI